MMAWISKSKRRNEGRMATYYSIQWRDTSGATRTRALGFCSAREAKKALTIVKGRLAAGESVEPPAEEPTATAPGSSVSETTLRVWIDDWFLPRAELIRARVEKGD